MKWFRIPADQKQYDFTEVDTDISRELDWIFGRNIFFFFYYFDNQLSIDDGFRFVVFFSLFLLTNRYKQRLVEAVRL